ncbi:MAG TPA: hypothetical protein VIL74_07010 [Pyrinomonadaceae bacterium]|jgi:hypothetical protein
MIEKENIIGQAIERIVYTFEIKDGCEIYSVFYRLANGVSFRLPFADREFEPELPPAEAVAANLPQIVGRRVEAAVCDLHDGKIMIDSVGLTLDDGTHLCDVPAAPAGASFAGIHVLPPGKGSPENFIDFWDERKFDYEFY